MKLVACPDCHAQYDVSDVLVDTFPCRCGKTLENRTLKSVDAEIRRCGACGAQVDGAAAQCTYCGAAIVREPGPLSLICPECFARNAESARFCTACGVAFQPEPFPQTGTLLPCPACEAQMAPSQVAGVGVNECGECHGLWVPGSHFDRLVQHAAEARRAAGPTAPAPRVRRGNPSAAPVRYRKCPECGALMLRRNFQRASGVILDVCHEHGTWLDADEIEAIAGFILAGGAPSETLETEHRRADALAAAARLRCATEAEPQSLLGRRAGSGLLGLLLDILR